MGVTSPSRNRCALRPKGACRTASVWNSGRIAERAKRGRLRRRVVSATDSKYALISGGFVASWIGHRLRIRDFSLAWRVELGKAPPP
jgi:hypothetical protein